MKDALIVDLDGTLCNMEHRVHLAETEKWEQFYRSCTKDTPNDWCMKILEAMHNANPDLVFFFITGRPSWVQPETEEWLQTHLPAELWTNSHLYLRPKSFKGKTQTVDFKKEVFGTKIKDQHNVLFAIDDDVDVVKMWRDEGLTCLDCAGTSIR